MRESLLKATEKRLQAKVAELKDMEARVNEAIGNRDKAEAQRFKSIVAMYENMKSKDAARILERLDMKHFGRGRDQDKSAQNVGNPRLYDAGSGRKTDRRIGPARRRRQDAEPGPAAEDRRQAERHLRRVSARFFRPNSHHG